MRKSLLIVLTLTLMFCVVFLVSCDLFGSSTENPDTPSVDVEDSSDDVETPDIDNETPPKDDANEQVSNHSHVYGELISAVRATCEDDGMIAHYYCAGCKTYFNKNKVEIEGVIVKALGHVYGDLVSAVEPTCEDDGHIAYYYCEECKKYFNKNKREVDDVVTPALGHNYGTLVPRVEPTCETAGNISYYHCEECETYFNENNEEVSTVVIDALGHDYGTLVPRVDPTCETDGNIAYYYCTDCETYFNENKLEVESTSLVIPALSHNYENSVCVECGFEYYTEGLAFTLNDDGESYSVSKGTATDENIVIPKNYNAQPVTIIGEGAFRNCSSLTNITIPESVTSIGSSAFRGCSNLTSVIIPNSVISIGESAFYGCSSLTSVTIPDSVTEIGRSAFSDCSSITSITIPNSVTSIGHYAFEDCTALTEINFNATAMNDFLYNTNNQSNYVFYKAGQAGSGIVVNIGANVTKIPAYLFNPNGFRENAPNIIKVVFAENSACESIGEKAFYYCSRITSITIPEKVTSIGDQAFNYCTALTEINFNATAMEDLLSDNNVFVQSAQNENKIVVNIGANVTRIPACIFRNTLLLTLVTFAENSVCESIGKEAFDYCISLANITIPNSVTSIGISAFEYCSSLTSVTIPNSVTSIGNDAFLGCRSLTSITIPEGITSIGEEAFGNCYKLVEVYNLSSLTITAGSSGNGDVGYYAKNVYTDTEGESKLTTEDGYIVYADSVNNEYSLIGYVGNETILTLPSDINGNNYSIYKYAFYNNDNITSVTIPNSVTSIGDGAFEGCYSLKYNQYDNAYYLGNEDNPYLVLVKAINTSITSCVIHEDTRFIHSSAFFNHRSITCITIPEKVTSIGYYAFYGCGSLTSVIIGESVTRIGDWAFNGCNSLTSVTIGNSVTTIAYRALYDCSALEVINYKGTVAEWSAIEIAPFWDYNTGDYTIYCTNGQIAKDGTVTMN